MAVRDNHYSFSTLVIVLGIINAIVNGVPRAVYCRQHEKTRQTYQNLIKEENIEAKYYDGLPKNYVKDCMYVASDTGIFEYMHNQHNSSAGVCGIYLMAKPDHKIEVTFTYFNVPCTGGDLASFVDGWELNGQYFPSPLEHYLQLSDRVSEFCSPIKRNLKFVSTENAALIMYRISKIGRGFTVFVRHIKNEYPCNIVADSSSDDVPFTLRNYGQHKNCTLIALYPCVVNILSDNINCGQSNEQVLIGGTNIIDTNSLERYENLCSIRSVLPERSETVVGCGVTAVKLISSGSLNNAVTVKIRKINENELNTGIICDHIE